jgi:hypothetical protein
VAVVTAAVVWCGEGCGDWCGGCFGCDNGVGCYDSWD